MATFTLLAPMPRSSYPNGTVVKFEAVKPTTGAAVSGVTVSKIAIYGEDTGLGGLGLASEDVPLFSPVALEAW